MIWGRPKYSFFGQAGKEQVLFLTFVTVLAKRYYKKL